MLTRLVVRNFKRFREIDIELGERVVFVGPNNSGKTTALQALALWNYGAKQWSIKRRGGSTSEKKRRGVTIGKQELLALPHPNASLLWRDTQTRNIQRIDGRQKNSNVRIDVSVNGIAKGQLWECGLEFDYANPEFIYCRPMRIGSEDSKEQMPVPEQASKVKVVYLPPMSGLAATEIRLDPGTINVRIGEGRTAEVLRNLCWNLAVEDNGKWDNLTETMQSLFGVKIEFPRYISERGEIVMEYREHGVMLDLSSSGRGLQQTLLIVAYMISNPGSTVLLDEPDAHLEILRQRQIYSMINDMAHESASQIIAASHSEVVLNEAAGKDVVVAFIGKPHRIADRGSQLRKSLAEISIDDYLQAEQQGWILYLEGATDLVILQAFAKKLCHSNAINALERPFVKYIGNQPTKAKDHYYGLCEAVPRLKSVALFDRLDKDVRSSNGFTVAEWSRREIESYLLNRESLIKFSRSEAIGASPGVIFDDVMQEQRVQAMESAIQSVEMGMAALHKGDAWGTDTKASDEVLSPIFATYYDNLGLPNLIRKRNFHILVEHLPENGIPDEVTDKLNLISKVASSAEPMEEE